MPRKKKEKAWHPNMGNSNTMRFRKILNIEWDDPQRTSTIYDVNVLEEIDTGEIMLRIFHKGKTVIMGVVLLDKNVGISDLHHAIRHNFRAWLTEKTPVWEFKHTGHADFKSPKLYEDATITDTEDVDKEIKVKKVPVKDRLKDTNLEAETPKKKRVRKPRAKKENPTDPKKSVATHRELKSKDQKVSIKGDNSSKTFRRKKSEPKATQNKKSTTTKKKTKAKQLF